MEIPREYIDSTCKIGQGADCCRYLMVGFGGFECGKDDPRAKRTIDARCEADTFKSLGDNCEGWSAHGEG